MKLFLGFIIGGLFMLAAIELSIKAAPAVPTIKYHHPEITSPSDIYQISMSESVSDACFDRRRYDVVPIEGAIILQQCELDSNRWHFNIKIK